MPESIGNRMRQAWNVIRGRDPTETYEQIGPQVYSDFQTHSTFNGFLRGGFKQVTNMIYNRIAIDCSLINVHHVLVDADGAFKEIVKDSLNDVLTTDANIDQSGKQLILDAVFSMLDEGCIAIVPYETSSDPVSTQSFKVYSARVGKIIAWYPRHVKVAVYDDISGRMRQIVVEKSICAIVENPFFAIMNEQNSTAQRLRRVLSQLQRTNENASSDSLNLLIQLPYQVNSEFKKSRAEERIRNIEDQLHNSPHGIAYTDATEKVVQLNRSLTNNLYVQARDLTTQLMNEMGLTEGIINGTADEQIMLNYLNQTIAPILITLCTEIERKWLSKTARTQGHAIRYFTDPFRLVPVGQIAEIGDKFTRNEIMTSNELRGIMGMKPSDDPKANELRNANLNHPDEKEVDTAE